MMKSGVFSRRHGVSTEKGIIGNRNRRKSPLFCMPGMLQQACRTGADDERPGASHAEGDPSSARRFRQDDGTVKRTIETIAMVCGRTPRRPLRQHERVGD